MFYSFFRNIFKLLLKIFFRLEIRGVENIPKTGGFVLVANHISYLDPMVLGAGCTRRLDYMAKRELFKNPLLRFWLIHCRVFAVNRSGNDLASIKEAVRRLKNGRVIGLFPQGSRKAAGTDDIKKGLAFLATKAEVPIIPAFIKGTDIALPYHSKKIKLTKISICFGEKMDVERGQAYTDIADLALQRIRQLG